MPTVDKETCVRCGGCISGFDGSNGCPQKAISLRDNEVQIDSDKCIDCGKCVQLCGLEAINP